MRIAIDYTPAYEQGGGIGRYVRELVAGLARHSDLETQYRLFVSGANSGQPYPFEHPQFDWKMTRVSPKWMARMWYRFRVPLPVQFYVGDVDLYHATDFVLPPVAKPAKTILTVHDLSFVRVPDSAHPRLKRYLEYIVPLSVSRADYILADSVSTLDDLEELYGLDRRRARVLLSGVIVGTVSISYMTIRNKYSIPDKPYILSVGTVQPRKNYQRLIKAVKHLQQRGYDMALVIVGGKGWLDNPIYQAIIDENMQDSVIFTGFADDTDLPALYKYATVTALPSLYEGFGIPILESMAYGTPVVTSNISSMPEAAGDAALLVDPYNVEEITDAIQRLMDDNELREQLIQKGYERANHLTWDRAAKELIEIYQHVLSM